jgi:hypothetical protein
LTAAPSWFTLEATAGDVLRLELANLPADDAQSLDSPGLLWRSRRWKSNSSIGSPLNINIRAPTDHFRYNPVWCSSRVSTVT